MTRSLAQGLQRWRADRPASALGDRTWLAAPPPLLQASVLMSAGGALFFFAGEPLMRLFTRDPEIISLGVDGLKVLALGQPLWALGLVFAGSLRGSGDTRFPMWVTLVGMWLLRIPFGWLIGIYLGDGLPGVYLSSLLDGACRGRLTFWRFRCAPWLGPV